jgi:hypothetical protein
VSEEPSPPQIVERIFGADSRRRMLEEYFGAAGAVTPSNAWKHVYRLLLWTDRTTGLAHCYESDKAQPGRPWYGRSLAFHDWVAAQLATTPAELGTHIDWLFTRGTERLAALLVKLQAVRAARAAEQRKTYGDRGFPLPGEDPALEALIQEELGTWLSQAPPPEVLHRLVQRIWAHLGQENKRKNLVGEGFEDVLASLIQRLPSATRIDIRVRPFLHSVPGFRPPPGSEKPRKVDLAIVGPGDQRLLASAKWSVRADREEQFAVDLEAYARLEDAGRDFDFVLVTNEFDAARLAAACDRRRQNASLFTSVVHVNPEGPLAAYGPERRRSARKLAEHVESGRLTSLERWLGTLIS